MNCVKVLWLRNFPNSLPLKLKAVMCIWEIPNFFPYMDLEFLFCLTSTWFCSFSSLPEGRLLICLLSDPSRTYLLWLILSLSQTEAPSQENYFLTQLLLSSSWWFLDYTPFFGLLRYSSWPLWISILYLSYIGSQQNLSVLL